MLGLDDDATDLVVFTWLHSEGAVLGPDDDATDLVVITWLLL